MAASIVFAFSFALLATAAGLSSLFVVRRFRRGRRAVVFFGGFLLRVLGIVRWTRGRLGVFVVVGSVGRGGVFVVLGVHVGGGTIPVWAGVATTTLTMALRREEWMFLEVTGQLFPEGSGWVVELIDRSHDFF